MKGISLTASMRSNLLSLQNISGQVSSTQNKLATGNKVNSAIDNPSSYYTALSLNNRADDLNALLDSMGQAVSTIKAATTALESATEFLEQAKAVANQALETAKPIIAQVSTEEELLAAIDSGKSGQIVINGDITLSENQTLTLKDGQSLVGAGRKDSLIFNITDTSIENTVNMANNTFVGNLNITFTSTGRNNLFYAKDKQDITFSNLNINFTATANNTINRQTGVFYFDNSKVELKNKLNIISAGTNIKMIIADNMSNVDLAEKSEVNISIDGKGTGTQQRIAEIMNDSVLNIKKGVKLNATFTNLDNSKAFYANGGFINVAEAEINLCYKNCGNSFNYGITSNNGGAINITDNSILNIKSNAGSLTALEIDAAAPGSSIKIEKNSAVHLDVDCTTFAAINILKPNGTSSIEFLSGTKLSLKDRKNSNNDGYWQLDDNWSQIVSSTDSAKKINDFNTIAEFVDTGETYDMFTDLPEINFDTVVWNTEDDIEESSQYQEIIKQYDALIKDASYKGINLLQTDKLSVKFNESNTASLNVQGKDMSSQALGFTTFEWQTQGDINKSIEELTSAINSIRNYSSELGNNYNIITTRQDFTESLINILTEGADKLTLADMNEESANMLALQTRQQLAINSLSLASQASQSILRLF